MAWSDGVVRLVGAESNKTVHQISTSDQTMEITCLGWASNSTVPPGAEDSWKQSIANAKAETSWDSSLLDLPLDLAFIDIESCMPKLSVLPAGGTS